MELTQRLSTTHGEIAFDVLGDGPPVVLVHGTPSRGVVWREVATALAEQHRVFVYDLLGFGDSERHVEQDVSVAAHGQVLAQLLRAWKLDDPAIVGHDIGGATALRAHLVEGAHFSRLALVDAVALRPWITSRTRRMQQCIERYAALPDAGLAQAIRDHLASATSRPLPNELFQQLFGQWEGAHGQALYLRNIRCLSETDTDAVEQRLETVTIPVSILWGAEDAWLPVSTCHRIAAAIGGTSPIVIPEAGHFCMLDQPQRVIAALRAFLGS